MKLLMKSCLTEGRELFPVHARARERLFADSVNCDGMQHTTDAPMIVHTGLDFGFEDDHMNLSRDEHPAWAWLVRQVFRLPFLHVDSCLVGVGFPCETRNWEIMA